MRRILEIAGDVFWIAVIVAGGGWLIVRSLKASDDPAKVIYKWLFTIPLVASEIFFARHLVHSIHPGDIVSNFAPTFVLVISIAGCAVIVAAFWGSHIGGIVAKPLADLFDGGNEEIEPKPYYSIALARRKMNRPLEAIVEIRKQLAKFPNDFEGVALLANIQAEDMKDLASAEMTFNHFCDSENAPPNQIAAALTQLADWHLKLFQDADSARTTLEKIIARFPETELSLQAAQRIAHLEGTGKVLLAAQNRQPVLVKAGVRNVGLLDSSKHLIPVETDPAKLTVEYVKHLAAHPQDTEAREKLAILYATHYQRLDLATLELAQLINEPNHASRRVAHWLNLLANLQLESGADAETVGATLEKIIERFPDFPVAEVARHRLAHLKLEIKGRQKETPGKKLGVYEQNIGLKYGSPHHSPRQL
ncbi:MAG TPA: tetratricopeptide repeat protein [Verrucomicrobiae bacterium]